VPSVTTLQLFFVVAGPFIGSFIGLLAYRWPENEPWLTRRSACRQCAKPLAWHDLLPILSWFIRRGRCRHCKKAIPILHPICEIGALIIGLTAWAFAPDGTFILSCLMGWTLLALSVIDWRSFILPDPLNLTLAGLGVIMIWTSDKANWIDHLIGGVVGYLILLGVELFYRHARGRDGLGRGDAKLLGALGLWVGWIQLPDILLLGSLSGLVAIIAQSRATKTQLSGQTALAFGPWLALGGWISWLVGPIFAL